MVSRHFPPSLPLPPSYPRHYSIALITGDEHSPYPHVDGYYNYNNCGGYNYNNYMYPNYNYNYYNNYGYGTWAGWAGNYNYGPGYKPYGGKIVSTSYWVGKNITYTSILMW